jgi:hypothetical protein
MIEFAIATQFKSIVTVNGFQVAYGRRAAPVRESASISVCGNALAISESLQFVAIEADR